MEIDPQEDVKRFHQVSDEKDDKKHVKQEDQKGINRRRAVKKWTQHRTSRQGKETRERRRETMGDMLARRRTLHPTARRTHF